MIITTKIMRKTIILLLLSLFYLSKETTAQQNSVVFLKVCPSKSIWTNIKKALTEFHYSIAEQNNDRLTTSYIAWNNMLIQNRGKIAITLVGETLRLEIIDRQYKSGSIWADAVGDLSKKNQEKYLITLSNRVQELLEISSKEEHKPVSANAFSSNTISSSFNTTICDNGICLEVTQAKIIGQRLLIKGKLMSNRGNCTLLYQVHALKMIADDGDEYKLKESCLGGKPSGFNVEYSLVNNLPVKVNFTFEFQKDKIDIIQYFDINGSINPWSNKSPFSLKIEKLPIPYNVDPQYETNRELEIIDGVYIKLQSWEPLYNSLKINLEMNNSNNDSKEITFYTDESRAFDKEGNELKIGYLSIGSATSDYRTENTIEARGKIKGSIEIKGLTNINNLQLLEIASPNNIHRFKDSIINSIGIATSKTKNTIKK